MTELPTPEEWSKYGDEVKRMIDEKEPIPVPIVKSVLARQDGILALNESGEGASVSLWGRNHLWIVFWEEKDEGLVATDQRRLTFTEGFTAKLENIINLATSLSQREVMKNEPEKMFG